MRDMILKFPARPLRPDERALVLEWIAAAGDIALAYVSTRESDDPALKDRIVVMADPEKGPSHLVHAPMGRNIWMVFSAGRRTRIQRFQTLRAALNSIRPVLVKPGAADEPVRISLI
jgi:hypothetical protein